MATTSGPQEAAQVGGGLSRSVPSMPIVPPHQIDKGTPYVLLDDSRHSIGWQDVRKAGPSFVVTTQTLFGTIKILQRFPLSEQGWAEAWQALSGLDASAAADIEVRLAKLEARRRAADATAALDGRSLFCLRSTAFDGGSDRRLLTKGQLYDLRFLDDRIMVCAERSADALVELPYADVETVEVDAQANQPTGVVLGWISGLGLLGAFVGFLLFGLAGLLAGAVLLGLLGGAIAAATSNNKDTIVRVRGHDAEFLFLDPLKRPDDVRRALSEPLTAIRSANAAKTPHRPAELAPDSVADQLGKLASLLQQD